MYAVVGHRDIFDVYRKRSAFETEFYAAARIDEHGSLRVGEVDPAHKSEAAVVCLKNCHSDRLS